MEIGEREKKRERESGEEERGGEGRRREGGRGWREGIIWTLMEHIDSGQGASWSIASFGEQCSPILQTQALCCKSLLFFTVEQSPIVPIAASPPLAGADSQWI